MGAENKPNIQMAVPFFAVSNIDASLRFYVDGLGFVIEKDWTPRGKIEWCWLARDGAAIMLQEPNRADPNYKESADKKGVGVAVCFQCMDALALYHEFKARGININEPFVGNNRWVVGMTDPDGYRIEFESETDVPEETMYSAWFK